MAIRYEATAHIHISWHRDSGAVLVWLSRGEGECGEDLWSERHTNGQGLVHAVTELARDWAETTVADQPPLPFD